MILTVKQNRTRTEYSKDISRHFYCEDSVSRHGRHQLPTKDLCWRNNPTITFCGTLHFCGFSGLESLNTGEIQIFAGFQVFQTQTL